MVKNLYRYSLSSVWPPKCDADRFKSEPFMSLDDIAESVSDSIVSGFVKIIRPSARETREFFQHKLTTFD